MDNKPTYTLIHGDCLEAMRGMEPASVDCVIADVPYGTTACSWDTIIPFDPMWQAIKHVIKPRGAVVLFGSEPFSSMLRVSNLAWYKYDWVWDKQGTANFAIAEHQPLRASECVMIFGNGSVNYFPQMRVGEKRGKGGGGKCDINGISRTYTVNDIYYPTNMIRISNANFEGRGLHPTQKPVTLMSYLVKTYTNKGDTILDFTCGSGSTGVGAVNNGRNFIGIDNGYCEKEGSEWYGRPWVELAKWRCANAAGEFVMSESERRTGQLALFEGPVA